MRNPDEGRYAQITREMVERNDWVEPRLYDVDYLKKPALLYWLVGLSFKSFGFTELAARAVPAAFGILGVLLTFIFALKVFDPKTAVAASLMTTTNFWYLEVGRYLLIDMVFSFFLVAGLYFFYLGTLVHKNKGRYYLPFYVCLAFSFLAKGPIGVFLSVSSLFSYLVLTRQVKKVIREMCLGWGIFIFLILVIPWYVLIIRREPEFLSVFLMHENFQRFVSERFQHAEPWYYYFLITPVAFIPWVFFPSLLKRSFLLPRDWKAMKISPKFFLITASAGLIIFYSLSQSKMATYILPVVPLLSLVMARGWVEWEENSSVEAWKHSGFVMGFFILIALAFIAGVSYLISRWPHCDPHGIFAYTPKIALCVALGALLGLWAIQRRNLRGLFLSMIFMMGVVSVTVCFAMEGINSNHTTKPFAEYLRPKLRQGDEVFIYGKPGAFYDFRFYLGFPVKLVGLEGELRFSKDSKDSDDEQERLASVDEETFYKLLQGRDRVYCLMRKSDYEGLDQAQRQRLCVLREDQKKVLLVNTA